MDLSFCMKNKMNISEHSADLGERNVREYQMQISLQLPAGLSQDTGVLSPAALTDRSLSIPRVSP